MKRRRVAALAVELNKPRRFLMQARSVGENRETSGARAAAYSGGAVAAMRPRDVALAIVLLGSVWGMVEVVLGGVMHQAGVPHRVAIVTGLGMGIMGLGLGAFRRVYMLPLIALAVVCVRQLAVPILHVPLFCKANSCLAVLIEAGALAGLVAVVGSRLTGRESSTEGRVGMRRGQWMTAAAVGGCAALVASGAFHAAGMRVAPCDHLLSYNRAFGLITYVATRGSFWAVSSAALFPFGYLIGLRLEDPVMAFRRTRPALYYAASAACAAVCWGASAVAISAGL